MQESSKKPAPSKWLHPNQVLQLHKLKAKKRALQERIENNVTKSAPLSRSQETVKKRNPFVINQENKRQKTEDSLDSTSDDTLFKLLHLGSSSQPDTSLTSFANILSKSEVKTEEVQIVKAKGEAWIPVDWALKSKIRFISSKPFLWNQKLKISEEASGITGFTRCMDFDTLDSSPNTKFHQCCLYWQQPSLPWLKLFPRTTQRVSANTPGLLQHQAVRESLQTAWTDSFRSLFQLLRTRQCPYFYVCANSFTVLFRAGGLNGFTEMNAMITPTTRGLRHVLKQEEIEFTMPLKPKRLSDQGYDTGDSTLSDQATVEGDDGNADEDETPDEVWLQNLGILTEDIKQINYTQAKIVRKAESTIDNSEQSLILIEGMELHALYNFLINCKSTIATAGPLAGVPPTLLAPVAFNGATLNALKVRENKVHVDNVDYFSLEVTGPILPSTVHNLCLINPSDHSMTATFSNVTATLPFSKVTRTESNRENIDSGCVVFGQENLSDCGLNPFVLKKFCGTDSRFICNVECIKYDGRTFTWT